MNGLVEWKNPPAPARGKYATHWKAVVQELKKRPGEFALVAQNANRSTAGYLRRQYGLQVQTRGTIGRMVKEIYAAYPKENDR